MFLFVQYLIEVLKMIFISCVLLLFCSQSLHAMEQDDNTFGKPGLGEHLFSLTDLNGSLTEIMKENTAPQNLQCNLELDLLVPSADNVACNSTDPRAQQLPHTIHSQEEKRIFCAYYKEVWDAAISLTTGAETISFQDRRFLELIARGCGAPARTTRGESPVDSPFYRHIGNKAYEINARKRKACKKQNPPCNNSSENDGNRSKIQKRTNAQPSIANNPAIEKVLLPVIESLSKPVVIQAGSAMQQRDNPPDFGPQASLNID